MALDPIVSYNTKLTPGVTNLTPAPALGPIYDYTPNIGLSLVNFDWATWHTYEWDNWRALDGILYNLIGVSNIKGLWQPNTTYAQGDRVVGPDGQIYEADADFTSGATFDANNWTLLSSNTPQQGGEWQTATNYNTGTFLASTPDQQYGVTLNNYTSSGTWAQDVLDGNILVLYDFSTFAADYLPLAGGTMKPSAAIRFMYGNAQMGRIGPTPSDFGVQMSSLTYSNVRVDDTEVNIVGPALKMRQSSGASMWFYNGDVQIVTRIASLTDKSVLTKADADALYSTASTEIGDAPPASPANGDTWYCTVDPVGLYIYYDDGDSAQWVQTNGSVSGAGSYLPIDGSAPMTGPLDIGSPAISVGENVLGNSDAAGLTIHNFTPAMWLYDRSANAGGILLQAENRTLRIYDIPSGGGQGNEMLRIDPTTGGTVYIGGMIYNAGASSQDGMRLANNSIYFQRDGADTNAYGSRIAYYWGTTYAFKMSTNGNLQNANNSYGSLSDERMKKDIVPAGPQLLDLLALQVKNFVKIDDPEQRKQIGLIAQEVQQVKPGWVELDPETSMLSVKYSLLGPSLLKALQELYDEFAARIAALEAKS